MVDITRLDSSNNDFWPALEKLLSWEGVSDGQVNTTVREILANVKTKGDAAVLEYTNRFDRMSVTDMADLIIPQERLAKALEAIPAEQREALELSAARVRA